MFGNIPGFEGTLFDEFRRLQDEVDELFGEWRWPADIRSLPRGSFPGVNVGSHPEKLEIYLFAPGVDPRALDISIQENLLTVAGERKLAAAEQGNYYRRERFSGAFRRSIMLPDDIDPDAVDARYRDGILQVSVRRRQATAPRQIAVH